MTEPMNEEQLNEISAAIYSDLAIAHPTTVPEAVALAQESAAQLMPGRRVIVEVSMLGTQLSLRLIFPIDDGSEFVDA